LKVLFQEIVTVPVEPVAFQKLLYVSPHPANAFAVADDPVNFIVEVLGFSVIPVAVEMFHAVLSQFIVHVPDPMFNVRVLDTFEVNPFNVRFLLFVSNVPEVSERKFVFVWIISSVKVSVPPIRFISILEK
jgi:hypothetical protein